MYIELKKIDINKFKGEIKKNNKHLNGYEQDPEKCVKIYEEDARSLLNKHALEKKVLTIRPKVEWYTDVVLRARKEKRKCERRWRTN